MKFQKILFSLLFLQFFFLGKAQNLEEKLENELHQIQNEVKHTGIVNNTVERLNKNYKVAKENKLNVAFLIGVELVRTYSTLNNAEKVIEVSTDIEKLINQNISPQEVSAMYKMKARSYGDLGFLEDSHKAYQKSRVYLKNIEDDDTQHYYNSQFYSNYSSYFDQSKKQSDSVRICLLKGLDEALKISDHKNSKISSRKKFDLITSIQANLSLYYLWIMQPSEPKTAEKFLLSSLEIAKNKGISSLNEMNLYQTAGDFYLDQKNNEKAIAYSLEGLKLEKKISSPYSREIFFEILSEAFLGQKNNIEAKKYSALLTTLKDSIKTAEKHSVNKVSTETIKQKEVEKNSTIKNYFYIFLAVLGIVGLGIWFYWRNKNKILNKKFQDLLSRIKQEAEVTLDEKEESQEKNIKPSNTIPEERINQIINKLIKFEKTEKFLKNDITIAWLAEHTSTNTKYLSEIIKQHRDKNFNNYINELRIIYIIKKLYEDPIYREYKISYLAEECGFSSSQVFAIAFKKETGFTPSYFIEQLKTELEKQA